MQVEENAPLSPLTTFRLGGTARFLVRASSLDDIREALAFAREKNARVIFLGGGSNTLVADNGVDAVIIKIELSGVDMADDVLIAAAGESWDSVVAQSCARGLWGIENLSGIPGTIGAAPIQNIGAYGSELKEVLEWVEVLDIENGDIVRMNKEECGFGYRTSIFKRTPGRYAVLAVALRLSGEAAPKLGYRDLATHFEGRVPATPHEVREAVLAIRGRKFPDLAVEGTAGSFFLNPVVTPERAAALLERYPELPNFAAESGVKLSLAWLLDHALNMRGTRVGGARLFEKQPIVVVADRTAKTQDVLMLATLVAKELLQTCGIAIEKEVQYVA